MKDIKKRLLAMGGTISIQEKNDIMKEIADAMLQAQRDGDDIYSIVSKMKTAELKEKELTARSDQENKEMAESLGLDTNRNKVVQSILNFFNGS